MSSDVRTDLQKAICSVGATPTLVTGYLRQWLESHFAQPDTIEQKLLRSKLWKSVRTETGIEIEAVTAWKPSTTEFRPALLIGRNDWNNIRLGIEDRMMGGTTSSDHYAAYFQGSHTVFAVSTLPFEAELLALEAYRELLGFGPVVRRELGLKRFQMSQVGKIFQVEEASQHYAIPITLAYVAEERWQITPHSPFLKQIILSKFLP